MTIEERAKAVLAQHTNQPTAIDLYSKNEVLEMLVEIAFEIAFEQKAIDDDLLREAKKMVIDKAVKWVDENVGTLTAIALRKAMEK